MNLACCCHGHRLLSVTKFASGTRAVFSGPRQWQLPPEWSRALGHPSRASLAGRRQYYRRRKRYARGVPRPATRPVEVSQSAYLASALRSEISATEPPKRHSRGSTRSATRAVEGSSAPGAHLACGPRPILSTLASSTRANQTSRDTGGRILSVPGRILSISAQVLSFPDQVLCI
jgi:hypothetical protein